MLACMTRSRSSACLSWILEKSMLSRRVQKNHIMLCSCQLFVLSFSRSMVSNTFCTCSLLLLFPTYTISRGICNACATLRASFTNFFTHSGSPPPYKKVYFPSLICPIRNYNNWFIWNLKIAQFWTWFMDEDIYLQMLTGSVNAT